jgi:hypothetical protein
MVADLAVDSSSSVRLGVYGLLTLFYKKNNL